MTLFRKVFHNQAQQVGDSYASAEDDVRKALTEAPDASGPYLLDPALHAVDTEDEGYIGATEEEQLIVDDDVRHPDLDGNEAGSPPEPEERRLQAVSMEDGEDLGMRRDDNSRSKFEGDVDARDEVAALLERTLPGPTVAYGQTVEPAEDKDAARPVAEQVPELVDHLEFDILSARVPEDDRTGLADEPEDADVNRTAIERAGRAGGDRAQAGPAETNPEKVDAREFARQQLQAMEATDVRPSAPDGSALAENEEDAAPMTAKPLADLSDGTDIEGVPAPAVGRAGRRAGRVKTRLLGFNRGGETTADPFDDVAASTATPQREKFPVGWLVIVEGPGRGHAFSIFTGASMIGRGEDQMIRLDFGDNSISRNNHAAIAYDDETNKFFIGHGGKSNIIRRNARPVLSTEELHHADLLRIGETTLRFVALCGSDFQWGDTGGSDAAPL